MVLGRNFLGRRKRKNKTKLNLIFSILYFHLHTHVPKSKKKKEKKKVSKSKPKGGRLQSDGSGVGGIQRLGGGGKNALMVWGRNFLGRRKEKTKQN